MADDPICANCGKLKSQHVEITAYEWPRRTVFTVLCPSAVFREKQEGK